MYRIYDIPSAIREVQIYLSLVGNPDIFVAPSGVYDENTRLSVLDFQRSEGLLESGAVDYPTFVRLYDVYLVMRDTEDLKRKSDSFITFPMVPGRHSSGMVHINGMIARLLDYYGYTHNLRQSGFYSAETELGVKALREIYGLEDKEYIDEILYMRMVRDHDSMEKFGTFNS